MELPGVPSTETLILVGFMGDKGRSPEGRGVGGSVPYTDEALTGQQGLSCVQKN